MSGRTFILSSLTGIYVTAVTDTCTIAGGGNSGALGKPAPLGKRTAMEA